MKYLFYTASPLDGHHKKDELSIDPDDNRLKKQNGVVKTETLSMSYIMYLRITNKC